MNSAFVFAIAIFMLAVIVCVVRLGGLTNTIQYLRKSDNRMILKGIIAFIGAGVLIGSLFGLFGCSEAKAEEPEAEWFKYGELYLGVDWPVMNVRIGKYPVYEGVICRGDNWNAKIKTIDYLARLRGENERLWEQEKDE